MFNEQNLKALIIAIATSFAKVCPLWSKRANTITTCVRLNMRMISSLGLRGMYRAVREGFDLRPRLLRNVASRSEYDNFHFSKESRYLYAF
jgi:hypothetical protein